MLDTSIIAAVERNLLAFDILKTNIPKYISSMTIAELLEGLYHANTETRKLKRKNYIDYISSSIPSIPFSNEEAETYSFIKYELKYKGINIPTPDLIIGATAIAHNCKVLTMNQRDFQRIPGLEIENIEEYLISRICYS